MTYKVMDSGLCYDKGIATVVEAMDSAADMVNDVPFGEIGTIEIVNETTGETEFTWSAVINWS